MPVGKFKVCCRVCYDKKWHSQAMFMFKCNVDGHYAKSNKRHTETDSAIPYHDGIVEPRYYLLKDNAVAPYKNSDVITSVKSTKQQSVQWMFRPQTDTDSSTSHRSKSKSRGIKSKSHSIKSKSHRSKSSPPRRSKSTSRKRQQQIKFPSKRNSKAAMRQQRIEFPSQRKSKAALLQQRIESPSQRKSKAVQRQQRIESPSQLKSTQQHSHSHSNTLSSRPKSDKREMDASSSEDNDDDMKMHHIPPNTPIKPRRVSVPKSPFRTPSKNVHSHSNSSTVAQTPRTKEISRFVGNISLTATGRKTRKRKSADDPSSSPSSPIVSKVRRVRSQTLQQTLQHREELLRMNVDDITDVQLLRDLCVMRTREIEVLNNERPVRCFPDLLILYKGVGLMVFRSASKCMAFCEFCCTDPDLCFEAGVDRRSLIHGCFVPSGVEVDTKAWVSMKENFRRHFKSDSHRECRAAFGRSDSRSKLVMTNQFKLVIKLSMNNQSDNQWPAEIARGCDNIDYGNKNHSRFYLPKMKRKVKDGVCIVRNFAVVGAAAGAVSDYRRVVIELCRRMIG